VVEEAAAGAAEEALEVLAGSDAAPGAVVAGSDAVAASASASALGAIGART